MVSKSIRRLSHGYHYFFVRPSGSGNAHETAERLMGIEDVREVSITEGAYGFVVKANGGAAEAKVASRINRVARGSAVTAVCHCQYVKQ